jgi:hypothetical protein
VELETNVPSRSLKQMLSTTSSASSQENALAALELVFGPLQNWCDRPLVTMAELDLPRAKGASAIGLEAHPIWETLPTNQAWKVVDGKALPPDRVRAQLQQAHSREPTREAERARDEQRERARAVRFEDELAKRGVALKREGRSQWSKGGCVICGSLGKPTSDRFRVNLKDQYFWCRECDAKGDIIAFVMAADGISYPEAVEYLAPSARHASGGGKRSNGHDEERVEIERYTYEAEDRSPLFQARRYQFRKADGSFVPQGRQARKELPAISPRSGRA